MVDELAPQGVAVDAEPLRRLRLVALGLAHDHFEQRTLDDLDDHLVHAVRLDAAQVLEVALQRVAHALFDVLLAHGVPRLRRPGAGARRWRRAAAARRGARPAPRTSRRRRAIASR